MYVLPCLIREAEEQDEQRLSAVHRAAAILPSEIRSFIRSKRSLCVICGLVYWVKHSPEKPAYYLRVRTNTAGLRIS